MKCFKTTLATHKLCISDNYIRVTAIVTRVNNTLLITFHSIPHSIFYNISYSSFRLAFQENVQIPKPLFILALGEMVSNSISIILRIIIQISMAFLLGANGKVRLSSAFTQHIFRHVTHFYLLIRSTL